MQDQMLLGLRTKKDFDNEEAYEFIIMLKKVNINVKDENTTDKTIT